MTTTDAARQQPTPASVWQALAGTTIGREVLEWPPAAAGVSWWMCYLRGLLAAAASCRLAWWALVRRAR